MNRGGTAEGDFRNEGEGVHRQLSVHHRQHTTHTGEAFFPLKKQKAGGFGLNCIENLLPSTGEGGFRSEGVCQVLVPVC